MLDFVIVLGAGVRDFGLRQGQLRLTKFNDGSAADLIPGSRKIVSVAGVV